MVKADSLSRRPDHKKGMEDDNKDVVLLKPEFFRIQALQRGHLLIHCIGTMYGNYMGYRNQLYQTEDCSSPRK